MMRDPDLLSVDAEEDWLCPECDAPYSKPGIEADLVAYVGSHPSAAAALRWPGGTAVTPRLLRFAGTCSGARLGIR